MSHPNYLEKHAAELRTSARELSGCGVSPPEIAKALKISQAEVLAFLRDNRSPKTPRTETEAPE